MPLNYNQINSILNLLKNHTQEDEFLLNNFPKFFIGHNKIVHSKYKKPNFIVDSELILGISLIILESNFSNISHEISGYYSSEAKIVINDIMDKLSNILKSPDRITEQNEIISSSQRGELGKLIKQKTSISFIDLKGTESHIVFIPKNLEGDNIRSLKRKILEWVALRSSTGLGNNVRTFIAYPYISDVEIDFYQWSFWGMFERKHEFLIGKDYWDYIGGSGTYADLVKIFHDRNVTDEYRNFKTYFNILGNKLRRLVYSTGFLRE